MPLSHLPLFLEWSRVVLRAIPQSGGKYMIKGLVLTAVAAAALVACAPAQQTAQSGGGGGAPKEGGTIRTWITTDPEDFDPSYGGKSIPNSYALSLAYSSLLGYKAGPDVPVEAY